MTINALKQMQAQKLPFGSTMKIVVVDDNSMDGTVDAINKEFPSVLVIRGAGNLYWAGAMRLGFSQSWDPNCFSHLLVFNDDCTLYDDAIYQLIEISEQHTQTKEESMAKGVIAVGSFHDGVTSVPTYGGQHRRKSLKPISFKTIKPTSSVQYADSLNMNLALISKECLAHHQLIAPWFIHDQADFDFGLRASRNGVPILVASGYQGICKRNSKKGTWEDERLSLLVRLRLMAGPKGLPLVPRFQYLRTHAQFTWPIFLFWPYLRVIVSHAFSVLIKRG